MFARCLFVCLFQYTLHTMMLCALLRKHLTQSVHMLIYTVNYEKPTYENWVAGMTLARRFFFRYTLNHVEPQENRDEWIKRELHFYENYRFTWNAMN